MIYTRKMDIAALQTVLLAFNMAFPRQQTKKYHIVWTFKKIFLFIFFQLIYICLFWNTNLRYKPILNMLILLNWFTIHKGFVRC